MENKNKIFLSLKLFDVYFYPKIFSTISLKAYSHRAKEKEKAKIFFDVCLLYSDAFFIIAIVFCLLSCLGLM